VQANREAGIVTSHVELLASDGQSKTYSVEEAATKIGWGIDTVRFLDAAGLAEKSSCLGTRSPAEGWSRSTRPG